MGTNTTNNTMIKPPRMTKKRQIDFAHSIIKDLDEESIYDCIKHWDRLIEEAVTKTEKLRVTKNAATTALISGNPATAQTYLAWLANHATEKKDREWARGILT